MVCIGTDVAVHLAKSMVKISIPLKCVTPVDFISNIGLVKTYVLACDILATNFIPRIFGFFPVVASMYCLDTYNIE